MAKRILSLTLALMLLLVQAVPVLAEVPMLEATASEADRAPEADGETTGDELPPPA